MTRNTVENREALKAMKKWVEGKPVSSDDKNKIEWLIAEYQAYQDVYSDI